MILPGGLERRVPAAECSWLKVATRGSAKMAVTPRTILEPWTFPLTSREGAGVTLLDGRDACHVGRRARRGSGPSAQVSGWTRAGG